MCSRIEKNKLYNLSERSILTFYNIGRNQIWYKLFTRSLNQDHLNHSSTDLLFYLRISSSLNGAWYISKHALYFLHFQAYFRQGVALQYLGRHADALAAFASGLAQDPKSLQLLVGMVEAAMKSPMRGKCDKSIWSETNLK